MREAHKGLPLTQVTPTSLPVGEPTADTAAASHAAGSQLTTGTDSSWGVPDDGGFRCGYAEACLATGPVQMFPCADAGCSIQVHHMCSINKVGDLLAGTNKVLCPLHADR